MRTQDIVAIFVFLALTSAMVALRLWGASAWPQLDGRIVVFTAVSTWIGSALVLGSADDRDAARVR